MKYTKEEIDGYLDILNYSNEEKIEMYNAIKNKKIVKFIPKNKLKCLKCGGEIMSSYSGEFVSCSCGSAYIDETEFYCRVGGNISELKLYNRENADYEWVESDIK